MPWSIALRMRWVSGSLMASSSPRSSSVSWPIISIRTWRPSAAEMSLTMRGTLDHKCSIGCMRVFITPCWSSVAMSDSRCEARTSDASPRSPASRVMAFLASTKLADVAHERVEDVDIDANGLFGGAARRAVLALLGRLLARLGVAGVAPSPPRVPTLGATTAGSTTALLDRGLDDRRPRLRRIRSRSRCRSRRSTSRQRGRSASPTASARPRSPCET